jgi:hypothetical protein
MLESISLICKPSQMLFNLVRTLLPLSPLEIVVAILTLRHSNMQYHAKTLSHPKVQRLVASYKPPTYICGIVAEPVCQGVIDTL